MNRSGREGLTLIEVLLTMAITAMVLAALSQLQYSGTLAATDASLTAEASVLCQSELDAWLAGNRTNIALDSVVPIPEAENWLRRFTLQPVASTDADASGMSLLTVEVYRRRQLLRPEFSLSRWLATNRSGGKS